MWYMYRDHGVWCTKCPAQCVLPGNACGGLGPAPLFLLAGSPLPVQ